MPIFIAVISVEQKVCAYKSISGLHFKMFDGINNSWQRASHSTQTMICNLHFLERFRDFSGKTTEVPWVGGPHRVASQERWPVGQSSHRQFSDPRVFMKITQVTSKLSGIELLTPLRRADWLYNPIKHPRSYRNSSSIGSVRFFGYMFLLPRRYACYVRILDRMKNTGHYLRYH